MVAQGTALGHQWSQWHRSPERAKQQAQSQAYCSWTWIPCRASEFRPGPHKGRGAHRPTDWLRDASCCKSVESLSSHKIAAWLARDWFRPFMAHGTWVVPLYPGRCPGLTCLGPFGAKNQTIDQPVTLVFECEAYKSTLQIKTSVYPPSAGRLSAFPIVWSYLEACSPTLAKHRPGHPIRPRMCKAN
jgi:hypothetical protein